MNDFTITTRLSKPDYIKFMYKTLYKNIIFLFGTLLGLYFVVTVILDYFNIINLYTKTPIFESVCGVFILAGPSLIVLIGVRQSYSNPNLQHEIKYTFGNNGIFVQGLTFKSELSWAHIIKQKETGKYLILYSSNKLGNFIDKSKLTGEQLQFIKSKVGKK